MPAISVFGIRKDTGHPFPVRFHRVQKPVDSILSEGFIVPACHDLHKHAAVTEDKAEKVPEDFERRMTFLLLSPAGFQETSDTFVSEKLL